MCVRIGTFHVLYWVLQLIGKVPTFGDAIVQTATPLRWPREKGSPGPPASQNSPLCSISVHNSFQRGPGQLRALPKKAVFVPPPVHILFITYTFSAGKRLTRADGAPHSPSSLQLLHCCARYVIRPLLLSTRWRSTYLYRGEYTSTSPPGNSGVNAQSF